MKNLKTIIINWQNLKSIRKAEKEKTRLENKGYNLFSKTSNTITYIKEK